MATRSVISALRLLLAGSALALATGCGDEEPSPDARAAAEAVEAFAAAYLDRDGKAACGLLTTGAQEEVHAAFLAASPGDREIRDCPSAVESLGHRPAEAGEVETVTVAGESATAVLGHEGNGLEVSLERADGGGWLVSEPRELLFGAPPG